MVRSIEATRQGGPQRLGKAQALMPVKWKRCVRKVRRSLRLRRRKGNPYAICSHLRGKGHSYGGYWDWEERVLTHLGGRRHRPITRSEMHEAYRAGVTSAQMAKALAR